MQGAAKNNTRADYVFSVCAKANMEVGATEWITLEALYEVMIALARGTRAQSLDGQFVKMAATHLRRSRCGNSCDTD